MALFSRDLYLHQRTLLPTVGIGTGDYALAFASDSPFIDPRSSTFRAPVNGVTDDATYVNAAVQDAPAGSVIVLGGEAPWTFKSMVLLDRDDVQVWVPKGATINAPALAGAGTSGIHDTNTVLCAFQVTGSRVHVQMDGHIAFGRGVADAAMDSGTNPTFLSSATAAFTSADVGAVVRVVGAGAAGVVLTTTIASVTSATVAVLTVGASTTVSAAICAIGPTFTTSQLAGIVVNGADRVRVSGRGRVTGGYCGLWVGGLATNIHVSDLEVEYGFRNILLGFSSQAGVQLRGWSMTGVDSHHSINDGLKITSSVMEGTFNGHFHHNAADGVDWYVGAERVTARDVEAHDNLQHGDDIKYASETSTYGTNRRVLVDGGRCLRNGIEGLAVSVLNLNDPSGSSYTPDCVEGVEIVNHESSDNTAAGYRLQLGPGSRVSNLLARGNGLNNGSSTPAAPVGGIRFEAGVGYTATDIHALDNYGVGIYFAGKAESAVSPTVSGRDATIRGLHARDTRYRTVYDAAITGGGTTLTSATATFVAADVGATVLVYGAGSVGANLATTIASRTNATTVELTAAAGTTVTAATMTVASGYRTTADAALTSGLRTLTSATAAFVAADIGAGVTVADGVSPGVNLGTTIFSVESATSVTLVVAAGATVSGKALSIDRRTQSYGCVVEGIQDSSISDSVGRNNRSSDWNITTTLAHLRMAGIDGRGQAAQTALLSRKFHHYDTHQWGTFSVDHYEIAAGASSDVDITITGIDRTSCAVTACSFNTGLGIAGLTVLAWVQADDTVRVRVENPTAGAITVGARYVHVEVTKYQT